MANDDIADLYRRAADADGTNAIKSFDNCCDDFVTFDDDGTERMSIYTDGSCLDPRHRHARAGWAAIFGGKHEKLCTYGALKSTVQTSYRAELRAVAEAICRCKVHYHQE